MGRLIFCFSSVYRANLALDKLGECKLTSCGGMPNQQKNHQYEYDRRLEPRMHLTAKNRAIRMRTTDLARVLRVLNAVRGENLEQNLFENLFCFPFFC